VIAIICAALLSSISSVALAQTPEAQSQVMTTTKEAPKIPNDQLDSLVAPIALYPDQLLSQTLASRRTLSRLSSFSSGWRRTRT
jgi:Protein of unknown function (DUF3300)